MEQCQEVILSDTSVPGEGEHKMMDKIRSLQQLPNYDPNTRHVFYGADADLIMLSLLTHEPHFMIIREEHVVKKVKQGGIQRIDISKTNNFQLLHISMLREYMFLEYRPLAGKMKMRFDLERIIDDFVFFCFFIGNDFLPSLSALDISEGSLDNLIKFYKNCLPSMTDYITDHGFISWDVAQPFIALLGSHEHQVFINRVKHLDEKYRDVHNLVTFDETAKAQIGYAAKEDPQRAFNRKVKEAMRKKKEAKIKKLRQKKKEKNYKKFLLLKKFAEDEDQSKQDGDDFIKTQSLIKKFKDLRVT
jgi:5'-3' exonuclease